MVLAPIGIADGMLTAHARCRPPESKATAPRPRAEPNRQPVSEHASTRHVLNVCPKKVFAHYAGAEPNGKSCGTMDSNEFVRFATDCQIIGKTCA